MIRGLVLGALAAAALPAAASAASYNFAGDYGNAVFQYGTGTGATFTAFSQNYASCGGDAGFACTTNGDASLTLSGLPAVGANTDGGSATFFTATVPNGTLFLHPGEGVTDNAILQFTAPTTSTYTASGFLSRLDSTGSGNGITASLFINGVAVPGGSQTFGPGLTSFNPGDQTFALAAGDTLRLVIGNNGEVSYDSTGLTGSIAAVPEPATWAMMIGGIGMAGGALRSRRRRTLAAA